MIVYLPRDFMNSKYSSRNIFRSGSPSISYS